MNPNWDDYKKGHQLYLVPLWTIYMALVLSNDGSGCIWWWIDVSFKIHPNMHGHTGATMSMGTRSIFGGSWKQKVVTRSSTKSEVVGVYDVLPHVSEGHGFEVKETVLYHDRILDFYTFNPFL